MSSKPAPDPPASVSNTRRPGKQPWSLAARLTAWYAGSTLLLVVLATSYLYWAMSNNIDREDDALLFDKARVARAVIQQRPGDLAAIRKEVEDAWGARQNEKMYVRILDANGRLLAESPGLDRILPSASFPAPVDVPQTGTEVAALNAHEFRVMTFRDPGSSWVIQLAMDRSLEVELLSDYLKHLWQVLTVALIVCAVVGYLIAHRGVRPILEIAKTARRIRPANLSERINPTRLPAELHSLAFTFNEMLDRLERAFGQLSRFSADIAHELRTPVANLRGEVEVALSKPRRPEEYRDVLVSNLEECGRLSHITDRLLFLARAENPETQIAKERCDIGTELAAVSEFYEAAATEAGIPLAVKVSEGIVASLDRSLFQRAVGNLIANALAHTPSDGTVTLTAREVQTFTQIEVCDTGCGIPPDHLPHVFDRFYRADASRTSRTGNVGLGLAIVRSIVELHGGSVAIASEVGKGTRIALSFPRKEPYRPEEEVRPPVNVPVAPVSR